MKEKDLRDLALKIVQLYMDGKITKGLQDSILVLISHEIKALERRG